MPGELRGKPPVGSVKKRAEAPTHWQTLTARRDYNQESRILVEAGTAVTGEGGDRTSIYRTVIGGFWPNIAIFAHCSI